MILWLLDNVGEHLDVGNLLDALVGDGKLEGLDDNGEFAGFDDDVEHNGLDDNVKHKGIDKIDDLFGVFVVATFWWVVGVLQSPPGILAEKMGITITGRILTTVITMQNLLGDFGSLLGQIKACTSR